MNYTKNVDVMSEKQYTKLFKDKIISRGWKFKKSTDYQDRYFHYDCVVTEEDKEYKVELKGLKFERATLNGIREYECQYIEFLNRGGNIGWLFGRANWFAFLNDGQKDFSMVHKQDLIDYSEDLFKVKLRGKDPVEITDTLYGLDNQKFWVDSAPAYYKLYRRVASNNLDIMTRVTLEDIDNLKRGVI